LGPQFGMNTTDALLGDPFDTPLVPQMIEGMNQFSTFCHIMAPVRRDKPARCSE